MPAIVALPWHDATAIPNEEFPMWHPVPRLALALILGVAPLSGQTAPPDLSDAEVAHVAVTANTIDIDLAKVAGTKATNDAVRKFAATMVTDHSAVNAQAAALAGRLGVTPKDNAVSQGLTKGAVAARAAIEARRGAEFDRAYIDREVAYHQAVLDALDTVLIPTTSNPELRKLLTDVRPAIAAHLEHAKVLQQTLAAR